MRPQFNIKAVEASTEIAVKEGHRLFQTHRYAVTDADQVDFLLQAMNPPVGATILDAGCGIGEVCRIMAELRNDLCFIMANISEMQLAFCPTGERFMAIKSDCHNMPLQHWSVDAVMFSSALCQMDIPVALKEAYRVMKPGGVLLVNDMVRLADDGGEMERTLAARVLYPDDLKAAIIGAGFEIEHAGMPFYTDHEFRAKLAADGIEHLIDNIIPIVIRAKKGD